MPRIRHQTPLSDLINARLLEFTISRTELMKRIGYANPAKGLRRFDEFLSTGQQTTHLLKALPDVMELDAAEVEDAAANTRHQIANREEATARERFHPHILVLAKREDGKRIPFFVQAFMWGNKVLGLPDEFNRLQSTHQVHQAARIVRQHFREAGGELGIWGRITGYRLQGSFDHAVILNTNGTIREGFDRNAEPPAPEIRIGGKRVPVGMFVGE